MAIGKFKIVYTDHVGDITDAPEFVTFDCDEPLLAVRAYGTARINDDANLIKFKVYPAEDKPLAEGERKAVDPAAPSAPAWHTLKTPDSSWIAKVTWRASDSSIGIHMKDANRGIIVYKSDYETFLGFCAYVQAGGSTGEFYNANIKGLERLN